HTEALHRGNKRVEEMQVASFYSSLPKWRPALDMHKMHLRTRSCAKGATSTLVLQSAPMTPKPYPVTRNNKPGQDTSATKKPAPANIVPTFATVEHCVRNRDHDPKTSVQEQKLTKTYGTFIADFTTMNTELVMLHQSALHARESRAVRIDSARSADPHLD
ncbi:10365_t:CDS:2, partial [Acaulospora colombiana]